MAGIVLAPAQALGGPSEMARVAWAVLFKGETYRPPLLLQTVTA